jgi:hypothetical protein
MNSEPVRFVLGSLDRSVLDLVARNMAAWQVVSSLKVPAIKFGYIVFSNNLGCAQQQSDFSKTICQIPGNILFSACCPRFNMIAQDGMILMVIRVNSLLRTKETTISNCQSPVHFCSESE